MCYLKAFFFGGSSDWGMQTSTALEKEQTGNRMDFFVSEFFCMLKNNHV